MLKNILTGLSAGKILDVGTGGGDLINCLVEELKSYDEIIGIDSREKSIDLLNENNKNKKVKFITMDASNLDFEDNSFDLVCISNTLHHLPDATINIVLNEMKRVLKPNGYFLICEMYCDNQTPSQMGHVYLHHFCAQLDRLNGVCHRDTFKRQEIITIINKLGLSIDKTSDFADLNDVHSKEEICSIIESIAKRLESLKDSASYEPLKTECKKINQWLNTYSLCSATELVTLCKKAN